MLYKCIAETYSCPSSYYTFVQCENLFTYLLTYLSPEVALA